MNKIKKTIALIICLLIAMGSFAFAEEVQLISAPANDYEGHWAEATIQKWLNAGKVTGYPDGSYKPNNNVTRAEFVKMVNGIINYNGKGKVTYSDVPTTEWYYNYISVAQEIGYISGYSDAKFGPNDYITREQAASILSRIQYLNNNAGAADRFNDKDSISSWAKEAVGAASEAGFIKGYDDGSFKPQNNLTRAEAITMLDNVLVNAKNVVIYNDGDELKNTTVKGDLIIAKTVGDGDVKLSNLDINGEIKVYGGGINSVYLNNVKVSKIAVEKDTVRLVFDNGTTVEEITVSNETILENKNGEIAKVTVTGNGEVTFSGNFEEVTVLGKGNIILDDVVISKLVVNNPINILGTGTIATLEANADGIEYEAKVEIKKVTLGAGVTEEPVVKEEEVSFGGGGGGGGPVGPVEPSDPNIQIIIKTPDQNTENIFNSITYKETDKFNEFLVQEIKSIFNKAANSSIVEDYIEKINDRINGLYIDEIELYSEDGWAKAINYLEGTDIEDDVTVLKDDLLNGIDENDINAIFDLYEKFGEGDTVIIAEKLTNLDGKDIIYNGETVQYKLTYKNVELTENSVIAEFILTNMLNSDNTVKEFFDKYGDVVFTATSGSKTVVITVKSVTL